MDCEEIEGKDGAREKRGEEEKQIVLKQIYEGEKKSNPFSLWLNVSTSLRRALHQPTS